MFQMNRPIPVAEEAGFAASGDGLNLGGNRQGDFLGTVASNVQANGGMNAVVIARKAGGVKQSRGAATRAEDADVSARAEEQRVTNHDLHATLLYLLGMDHKRLTYYFNGRNMRLTDVSGELIPQIAGNPPAKA